MLLRVALPRVPAARAIHVRRALSGVAALAFAALGLFAPWAGAQAPPVTVGAPMAPRVVFAAGEIELLRGEARRPLVAGEALVAGDGIATGPNARAQLLLADGSWLALQEDSQVRLAAGAELGFAAGSLRLRRAAATGDFVLRTGRAAVRVRGPAFSAAYNADGSVNLASEREPVEVCTEGGCLTAGDDNLRVRGDALPPTRTNARATWR